MSRTPRNNGLRRNLRGETADDWPLDQLLVGVATLRTIRELFQQDGEPFWYPPRAWDLAVWSGVSPQGSANALKRLERLGLATAQPSDRPWRAPGYRLDWNHPLVMPLARLFAEERAMVQARRRSR